MKKTSLTKVLKTLGFLGLVLVGSSYFSCRKPYLEDKNPAFKTISSELNPAFDLSEIIGKIPQTVLYNLGDDAVFFVNETKVKSDESGVATAIQFPINHDKTKFIYAIKDRGKGDVKIYVRNVYESSGKFEDGNYEAIEEILDLQTYQVHTQRFEKNELVAYKLPIQIAEPYWETCMLEKGAFTFDSNLKIVEDTVKLLERGGPNDCVNNQHSNHKGFFERFNDWLGGVFGEGSGDYSGGGGSLPWIPGGAWHTAETGGSGGGGGMGGGYNPKSSDPNFNQPQTAPGFEGTNSSNSPWGPSINYTGPLMATEIPDTDGYLSSRKTGLKIYLQNNPYGAIDCNDIANLPMEHYQNLATFVPPNSVLQRIQDIINANNPVYTNNNTFIQKITDGIGVVNMDLFSVHIHQFPLKSNGQPMTPLEFLDFFRKNKSKPILPTYGGNSFAPLQQYVAGSININETSIYNSDYQNSLGAWVSIHIPLPKKALPWPLSLIPENTFRNDGTVVLSDYHIDHTNQKYWYTFTTMSTVYDGTHPVCGNRRFGIYPHPQGGWQFYTSGVDRIWDETTYYTGMSSTGFEEADHLWTSIQNSVINYCNANGGQAQHFYTPPIKARIDWNSVQKFLKGEMTLQALKNLLGCP